MVISLIGCLVGVAVGSPTRLPVRARLGGRGFEVNFFYPTSAAIYALVAGLGIGIFAGATPRPLRRPNKHR